MGHLSKSLRRVGGGILIPGDPFYNDVIILLNCNEPNGTTSFLNEAPIVLEPSLKTNLHIQDGYMLSTGDRNGRLLYAKNTHFNRNIDLTIECYINFLTSSPNGTGFFISHDGTVYFRNNFGGVGYTGISSNGWNVSIASMNTSQEYHLAIVRTHSNRTNRIFLDGNLITQSLVTHNATLYPFAIFGVGERDDLPVPDMKIRGFRYTKAARYTENFIPPQLPLPNHL